MSKPSKQRFVSCVARLLACGAVFCFVVAAPTPVAANSAMHRVVSPSAFGPGYAGLLGAGRGIKMTIPGLGVGLWAGEFVLQPRFFVEGHYSTNFFRRSTRSSANNEQVSAFALHVRPGIALLNPNFQNFAFSLSVDVDGQVPISDNEDVQNQQDVGVQAHSTQTLFPKSALTFMLEEAYNRQLFTKPAGGDLNADRNHLRLGPTLAFHPGGRALELKAGYRYDLVFYEGITEDNTLKHDFNVTTTWRFLPKSFFFLDGRLAMLSYPDPADDSVGFQVPGMPSRVYGGLSGFLTERVSVMLRGGYGHTMLEDESLENFESFIGEARASLRFSDRTVLHLGASRDFENSTRGAYFSFLRGYVSFEKGLGDLLLFHLDVAYDRREFGQYIPPSAKDDEGNPVETVASKPIRTDDVLKAGALLDIDFVRIFGASIGYRFETNITDYNLRTDFGQGDPASVNHFDFSEHRIFATLNLRY